MRLRRDRERLRSFSEETGFPAPRLLAFHPSYQCIWLHRMSNYFFRRNHRLLARFLWHLNLLLTGADIGPITEFGPGLLLFHPITTQIFGRLGADCTIWGHCGIGGGRSNKDIGAGPGLPIIGDNVTIWPNSLVLGPIHLGDGVEVGPGCIIIRDLPPGTKVELAESCQRSIANSE
jgi:serine O-acetyltransferase